MFHTLAGMSGRRLGDFFGAVPMLREFWAEDPSWTNPGDGNALVTIRDNGSEAADLSPVGVVSTGPSYNASGLYGRPAFEFHGDGGMSVPTGLITPPVTVGVIAELDVTSGTIYITSRGDAFAPGYALIGGANGDQWRFYNTNTLNGVAGTSDTSLHCLVMTVQTDELIGYLDGTQIFSDTSGSVGDILGFSIGSTRLGTAEMDGRVGYAWMYDGIQTDRADWSAWLQSVHDHYAVGY